VLGTRGVTALPLVVLTNVEKHDRLVERDGYVGNVSDTDLALRH
jgi:hypothetical protein